MAQAIAVARVARRVSPPNPWVGAVIVDQSGQIVATGSTQEPGKAHAEIVPMAIGSAAIKFNINFVLDNLQLRKYFPVVVSADDVLKSKPDPEVFLKAAHQLNVQPENCIVFEDAPKGVESALNAGMKAVVITTLHSPKAFDQYDNVLAYISDYTTPILLKYLHQ